MVAEQLQNVRAEIRKACEKSGRNPEEVTLIAVSKTKPISMIREAMDAGQTIFGENKVQELCTKYEELPKNLEWHLIGHLQRNKVKYIADKAALIHSVDSLRLAETINHEGEKIQRVIPVLIEVNVAQEETKFGVSVEETMSLIEEICKLPYVQIQGLMTIAPYVPDPEENRPVFRKLKQLSVDISSKNMNNVHMVLLKKGLTSKEKTEMLSQIKDVDGVKWALGMDSFVGAAFPDTMIPSDLKKMLESDEYEMEFICSEYKTATDEVNNQIDEIQKIVKGYSPESMVIGEAPLTKDLQDVTDVDLKTVNTISILAIFIIIMIVFKSISLPVILVAVIEFAIFVNMSVPYYQGKEVVFVASIVIGCIQLGATVDYAILMTTRYQKERSLGKDKMEAISIAHKTSMPSIISSGLSFFAATFGVACYSQVEMIGSICTLLARGAIISMVVVLLVLPAMFMIFDKLICKTSIGFLGKKAKAQTSEAK